MKYISLLPPEIKAIYLARQRQKKVLLGSALALLAIAAVYAGLSLATLHYHNVASSLRSQRVPLESEMSNYQEFVEAEGRMAALDSLIKQALGKNTDWAALFIDINRDIPANVWLTEVTITSTKGAPKAGQATDNTAPAPQSAGDVMIRGWTFDYPSVAVWLEKLGKVPYLTEIKCQYANQEQLNNKTMVKFEIKSTLQPPATAKGGQKTK